MFTMISFPQLRTHCAISNCTGCAQWFCASGNISQCHIKRKYFCNIYTRKARSCGRTPRRPEETSLPRQRRYFLCLPRALTHKMWKKKKKNRDVIMSTERSVIFTSRPFISRACRYFHVKPPYSDLFILISGHLVIQTQYLTVYWILAYDSYSVCPFPD